MTIEKLCINQTLHGYSKGHRLLQSSKKLQDRDAKMMIILSDLSGNEVASGFEKYYTGYRLNKEEIVLACTWYANEMNRPGCVWTHSLIINIDELTQCHDSIGGIFELFKKPNNDDDIYEYYNRKLELALNRKIDFSEKKLKYIIWCIWGNRNPIVIFSEESSSYEKELIYLFLMQHDLLQSDFSFCTGSASLRNYEGRILDLQVAPYKVSRSKMFIGEKAYEAKEAGIIKNYPVWVNKVFDNIKIDNLRDLKKFRQIFPEKYRQHDYFTSFVKLYVGSESECRKTNLISLLQISCVIFQEKEQICREILELYRANCFGSWKGKESYTETVNFFINNLWLNVSLSDIEFWTIKGFSFEYLNTKKLFKDIVKKDENWVIEEALKVYATELQEDKFLDFTDLEYECCSTLITLNSRFALCEQLWTQSKGYQQGIIKCLQIAQKDEEIIEKVIMLILETSEYDLALDLYKVYRERCLNPFWKYMLFNYKSSKVKGIKSIVKSDVQGGVKILKSNLNDRERLLFLIDLIDPYNPQVRILKLEEIKQLYSTIMIRNCTKSEKITLAKFLIPFCIMQDYLLPRDIAWFTFSVINELLASQLFPENEWEKLERILPEVAFYNSWDRCKRLRKGFKKKGYDIKSIVGDELPIHLL